MSGTVPNTYGDMQNRIANEVLGSPTADDIKSAIQDAISTFERETFYFNSIRLFGAVTGSLSDLATVPGKEWYSYQDLPSLVNMPHISKVMVLAFGNRYPLVERTPFWIDDQSISPSWQGLPSDWAWQSNALRLYPIPDGNYPLIIDGTTRFPALVNTTDFNAWCNESEQLIRTEAKRTLFVNITRDPDQAQAMELEIYGDPRTGRQGYLGQLRRESMRRSGGMGRIRGSRGWM